MIMFYYSVVTGWTLKYVLRQRSPASSAASTPAAYWEAYSAVRLAAGSVPRRSRITIGGSHRRRGRRRAASSARTGCMIPTLFVLLLVAVARVRDARPARAAGLAFLFVPDLSALLADYRTWLEALTQSAWSTGAGWGLLPSPTRSTSGESENVVTQRHGDRRRQQRGVAAGRHGDPAGRLRHPVHRRGSLRGDGGRQHWG